MAENQVQNSQVMRWKVQGEKYDEIVNEVVDAVLKHKSGVLKIEYSYYAPNACCVKESDELEITYDPNGKLQCKDCDEETMAFVHYYHGDYQCGEHVYGIEHHVVAELWINQISGINYRDDEDLRENIEDGLVEMLGVITGNAHETEDAIDIAHELSDAFEDFFYTERKGMNLDLYQSGGPDCPRLEFDMYFTG